MKDSDLFPQNILFWSKELGTSHDSLVRLSGGINNNVYRCGTERHWIIKSFPPNNLSCTDRMQAEVEFLNYANKVASGFTPKLFHVDFIKRCIILEYLRGVPVSTNNVRRNQINTAIKFFSLLNCDSSLASEFISQNASEGYLSLTCHLANICERIDSMSCANLPPSLMKKSKGRINQLRDTFENVSLMTERMIENGDVIDTIPSEETCISPGDFGFHNSILTDTGLKFFDFEHAGYDDPAKTISDFQLQPMIPVPQEQLWLLDSLPYPKKDNLLNRISIVSPIMKVKWLCIILSALSRQRLDQILLNNPSLSKFDVITERLYRFDSFVAKHLE